MIVGIIQARMSSSRLPGKAMMQIRGLPLLYYVINQVKQSKKLDNFVIATTTLPGDDKIASYSRSLGLDTFRGSVMDVMDRYYQCAKKFRASIIVRISSDCPLIDPRVIDDCISKFENSQLDYLSNTIRKENGKWIYHLNGFPAGFAVEAYTFDALEKAWKSAKKPSEREHVSFLIKNNPYSFKLKNFENNEDMSNIRLTVDHKIDFDLIKKIIESFQKDEIFTMNKVIKFLNQNPELKQSNAHIPFNEGYLKSLKEDKND